MKHQKILRSTLQVLCSILVVSFTLLFPRSVLSANGVNKVINFQGKVTNASGTNVTDGTYDFVIKIYDGASSGASTLYTETWSSASLWSSTMSSAPGSGAESLTYSTDTNEATIKVGQILWNTTKKESVTITSINTGTNVVGISPTRQAWAGADTVTNQIYVRDGVFKVAINSLNADLSGVNFNTDSLFMGVEFNSDGEMKPRIQYTATPYAFNAEKVNGLTVTNTSDSPFSSTTIFKIGDGKTVVVNNGLTFSGTDTTTFTFPGSSGTVVTEAGTAVLTNKSIGSGGLLFTGADIDIATTSNQHFSIIPHGTGNVGIGTTTSEALLHILGLASTTPTASISSRSSFAGLVIDNTIGDLFTASSSGLERFTVTNGGAIRLSGSTGTGAQCLLGGSTASWGSCSGTAAYVPWIQNDTLGLLYPVNSGLDFLFGGQSSASAKFKLSTSGAEPTASISGTTGQATLIVDNNGTGDLFAASSSGLNRFVINQNGNVGIGLTNTSAKLDIKGTTSLATLGSEMITATADRDFSSDTGKWTGTNWSIGSNVATHVAGANAITLDNTALSSAPVAQRTYQVTFSVTTTTAGSIRPSFGGVNGSPVGQKTGTLSNMIMIITATNTNSLIFTPSAVWTGTIDNISVKDITASTAAIRSESSDGILDALEIRPGGSGKNNTFVGNRAGELNVSGGDNTALGTSALAKNISGTSNNAFGAFALASNTTGGDNVAIGGNVLSANISGSDNIALGWSTMLSNITGTGNLAFGYVALQDNTIGDYNLAFGSSAGSNSISGDGNVFIGKSAGVGSGTYTLASNNVIIGTSAGNGISSNMSRNVYLGFEAGYSATGSDQLYIANSRNTPLIYGDFAASALGINTSAPGNAAFVVNQPKNTGDLFVASQAGIMKFKLSGIGTESTASVAATTSYSGLVVDNTIGDLFTASSSGLTRFVLKQDGTMGLGLSNPTAAKFVLSDSSLAPGVDMMHIAASTGTSTTGVDGLQVDFANTGAGAITNSGLTINATSNNSNASSILYGLQVGNLTSGGENASEIALRIGTGWDQGLIIESGGSTNSGLVYSGAGRPTKTVTLSPEYAGAVITAFYGAGTDTDITGSMTSDTDTTPASSIRNYYEWNSSQTAAQHSYTVAVRVKLPSDFSGWATSNALTVSYITGDAADAQSELEVRVYIEGNGTIVTSSVTGNSEVTWSTATIDDSALDVTNDGGSTEPEWDETGETAVIYLRMLSQDDDFVRVGDITLNYLAKF